MRVESRLLSTEFRAISKGFWRTLFDIVWAGIGHAFRIHRLLQLLGQWDEISDWFRNLVSPAIAFAVAFSARHQIPWQATLALGLFLLAVLLNIGQQIQWRLPQRSNDEPRLLAVYAPREKGQRETLTFTNKWSRPVINLTVGPLADNGCIYDVVTTPGVISSIEPSDVGKAQIAGINDSTGHNATLADILQKGTPESVDLLTIKFEDLPQRYTFEQVLTLTLQSDGSIRFDYGPVKRRAKRDAQ